MDATQQAGPPLAHAANIDDRDRPRFVATGATSMGHLRLTNEDRARLLPELGLFLVADGVSGGAGDNGGADAAQLASDTIAEHFARGGETTAPSVCDLSPGLAAGMLRAAIEDADQQIRERGRFTDRPAMCTTVAALLVAGPGVVVAHVGDSRVYRLRGGALERLTTDHTELALSERFYGRIAPPDVRRRLGHIIHRALGGKRPGVTVDVCVEPWEPGDLFLLSSAGLHRLVSDEEMAQTITSAPDLDCAVVRLLRKANEAGGHDNITAILVRVLGG